MTGAAWSVAARLAELYRRLEQLPRASSADEALQQICDTLEQVEDELSGIAKQTPAPPPEMPDGRMYSPREDRIRRAPNGSIQAETRRQIIAIAVDGSIAIRRKGTTVAEFTKPGASHE